MQEQKDPSLSCTSINFENISKEDYMSFVLDDKSNSIARPRGLSDSQYIAIIEDEESEEVLA